MEQPSDFGGLFSARRIVVTGANGAGKSTLARKIAAARDLPLHHNDALALRTGWEHRPLAEVAAARDAIAQSEYWIIEGGPSVVTQGQTLARADLVIWIDLPAYLRCWRILMRSIWYRGRTRPDLPDGNPEALDMRHWRFVWKAWRRGPHFAKVITVATQDRTTLRLKSRDDVCGLIDRL